MGPYNWFDLPTEIRFRILDLLANTAADKTKRRAWPSVCWDWRHFFEDRNFSSLVLRSYTDIHTFSDYVTDHLREKVKRIRLHVPLQVYTCKDCDSPEDDRNIRANNAAFTGRLLVLLNKLAEWQPRGGGLTLEISAASASDTAHILDDITIGRQRHNCRVSFAVHVGYYHDPGLHLAKQRILGKLLDTDTNIYPRSRGADLRFDQLQVPVVTNFAVSRDSRRSLSAEAIATVFSCLPRLREVVYEPWRGMTIKDIGQRNRATRHLLRRLPKTVSSISLQEARVECLNDGVVAGDDPRLTSAWDAVHRLKESPETPPIRDMILAQCHRDFSLALDAVAACKQLQSFSASSPVDALEFLRGFGATSLGRYNHRTWPFLTTINLRTARVLEPELGNELFLAAGGAAAQMPQLRLMELWDARETIGTLLRYEVCDVHTALQLETTIDGFTIGLDALEVWRAMVRDRHGKEMKDDTTVLSQDVVATLSRFRTRLRLRESALARDWNILDMYETA
ncbi:hypothetical protein GCG54_00011840 [Colletotrichum gloeosporioides]|uniref:DUF6546 domain-containing protein n=1 Tax=Colletotrichum gloeosporioides TaxID=474922 RepID=A0A8H4CFY6_COLGL|nr:uncharacterized protein GCG54_00011840 [Colletotrichum gloeosporioides]KAF3803171.1 hypothetical protein GCG54_00011840 [Colletotrichum gloeosporioides]